MAYMLDEFAADYRRILKADPGPAGRETVRKRLQDLLMNEDFIAANCGPNASAREASDSRRSSYSASSQRARSSIVE